MERIAVVVFAIGVSSLFPITAACASAQAIPGLGTVSGSVRDSSGRGIEGARVAIIGGLFAGETDDEGGFRLGKVPAGTARLAVRRIGFAPETLVLSIRADETTDVSLALRRVSALLAPVVVQGRRDVIGPLSGFYARLDRGQGRFFTFEQIDDSPARRMSDLLRGIPGMRISAGRGGSQSYRMRGSNVAPLVWLDGVPMANAELDLDNFDPRTFAGIEIYSGAATVPIEFTGGRTFSSSGGTIVLWTREGTPTAKRRKKDDPPPAVLVRLLLDRNEAFTRDEVDTPAVLLEGAQVVPIYPDTLYNAGLPGQVTVEFVVDREGRARMDTFGGVAGSHRSLVEAVRRAVEERRFAPATRQGRAVAQVVHLPFSFIPDSGTRSARKPEN